MEFSYHVPKSNFKKRLDSFLVSRLCKYTRNFIQAMIKEGNVKVNSKVVNKCSKCVGPGDIVYINIINKKMGRKVLTPKRMEVEVIYRDKDLLVVNKVAGIAVHPGCGNYDNTLLNGLIYRYKEVGNIGEPYRLGLVHRIDKDTSGTVIVALNDYALWYLSRQFEKRSVEKLYIAVVKGNMRGLVKEGNEFCVSNYIARSRKNRKKMTVVSKEKGKLATTFFYLLQYTNDKELGEISVVIAKPRTGRTHQIRVHLSQLGFPIIGDKIYSNINNKRMLLHAYAIKIKMLNGKFKCFRAHIPKEFDYFLEHKKIIRKVNKLLC